MDMDKYADGVDKAIGERLRRERDARRISRARLEEITGISAKSIQRYETGKRSPEIRMLAQLVSALGLDFNKFMRDALK